MEIKEYKKAVSEIKASEEKEKKEVIIGTLVAQTSSTSKEVKTCYGCFYDCSPLHCDYSCFPLLCPFLLSLS